MRKRWLGTAGTLGAVCAMAWLAGCSAQSASSSPRPLAVQRPAPPPEVAPASAHVTMASWYGPGFNGRRTSSGEVYNRNGLTAASRTLPIGSHVRVTNLSNGRSVVVRINDRGPFVRGRGIDLSQKAAQQIGLDHSGVARVQIARADDTASASLAPTAPPEQWSGRVRVRHYTPHHRRNAYHYRYASTTSSSKQIVANPVGDWLLEMVR
jgi:rare lipoprotein A